MGSNRSVTPRVIVKMLNSFLALDKKAVSALFKTKIYCNVNATMNKDLRTERAYHKIPDSHSLTPLALLNSFFVSEDYKEKIKANWVLRCSAGCKAEKGLLPGDKCKCGKVIIRVSITSFEEVN